MSGSKVSAVMCTYRRAKCVQRAINCFINQTYKGPSELIVFNTDEEYPYELCEELKVYDITIVNCNIDYETGKPYTNVGAIRRDALTHATGDYYICWDDDDIFLPWFIEQGMDFIKDTESFSFKPEQSFFFSGDNLRLVMNTMEASIISCIKKVREYGFLLETGSEGLGWYTKMRDKGELNEHHKQYVPSYCFNWNDGEEMNAGHKQSGDINNPNNFENHKLRSLDMAKEPVQAYTSDEFDSTYKPYFEFISEHKKDFPSSLYDKYVVPLLKG